MNTTNNINDISNSINYETLLLTASNSSNERLFLQNTY